MNELLNEIQAATKQIEATKKELADKLKKQFKDLFVPFFDKYPEVKRFRWKQYTPYFNDGEPCEFGVYDLEAYYNETDSDEDDDSDGNLNSYHGVDEALALAFNSIPSDLMKSIFGDHAEVTVTRGGITVEEYEHD